MTINEFIEKYNMHDSLIDSLSFENNKVYMTIDFAFWMQSWFIEGNDETGPLKLEFCNVASFHCPDNLPLENVSILETSVDGKTIKFALINDMTDEYLEILIQASSVLVL